MSYRDSDTGYDPHAYEQPGRPLRPFNWVQWTGVALIVAAIAALFAYFFGRAGLIPPVIKDVPISTALAIVGSVLVNSRREPGTQLGEERLRRNRKVLLITIAVCVAIAAAAAVIEFKGA